MPLDFSNLTTVEEFVPIGSKTYTLREASGDAVCKWRNAIVKATKLGADGKPVGADGLMDSEPLLVSLCLFEQVNGVHNNVPVTTVRSWPYRVQQALYERIKEISHLDEDNESVKSLEDKIDELKHRIEQIKAKDQAVKN